MTFDPETLDPEICRKCGGRGELIRSRRRMIQSVSAYRIRRRQCALCNHRWNEYLSRLNPKQELVKRLSRQPKPA